MASSTLQLLRFPFSFFLLPIYLFALSQVPVINWPHAILVFFILHILVYPASNGYNSYMDKDESSIGGIEKPQQPTRELFFVTVAMDLAGLLLSLLISKWFALGILLYILASRAYSFRGIRLKKYPVIGYLTVVVFQGALVYWLAYYGSGHLQPGEFPATCMLASSLLIGGSYPLTQVYQHEEDAKDGVTSISRLLGYRGTFIFCGFVYSLAFGVLGWQFFRQGEQTKPLLLATCMLPVLVYFFFWARKVWNDTRAADFRHAMRMNWLAGYCSNAGFLLLLILKIAGN
jgi:1,4-dihydroxy-2-naphthoate octaprenyltransferase